MKEQVKGVLAIAWINGWLAVKRYPLWIASYLTPPLSLLIFVMLFMPKEMVGFALSGGLVMVVASNGIGLMGDAAYYRIYLRFQEMVVASPMRPTSYMLGLALSSLIYASPGIVIFVFLMSHFGYLARWVEMLLYLVLCWASAASLGFALSGFLKEPRHVWPLAGILTFILTIIPPVYYPSSTLPGWMRLIGEAIPTGGAATLLHYAMGLPMSALTSLEVVRLAALLTIETVALLFIAIKKSRWREK